MSEPKPKYFDDNGVAFAQVDGDDDYYANELYKLEGEHSRLTIQLGRYRHALRVIAGLTKEKPYQEDPADYASAVLETYDDHFKRSDTINH